MGREDDSIKIYIKDIEDKFVKDIDGNNVFTATKISDVENILLQNVHNKRKYRIFYKGKAITGKDKYKQLSSITIAATDGNPLTIDGEVKGSAPLSVSVLPLALSIIK